jgi:hypothetical protein
MLCGPASIRSNNRRLDKRGFRIHTLADQHGFGPVRPSEDTPPDCQRNRSNASTRDFRASGTHRLALPYGALIEWRHVRTLHDVGRQRSIRSCTAYPKPCPESVHSRPADRPLRSVVGKQGWPLQEAIHLAASLRSFLVTVMVMVMEMVLVVLNVRLGTRNRAN